MAYNYRPRNSKILKAKIVDDPTMLETLRSKFGYTIGDLVHADPKTQRWQRMRSEVNNEVRCSWVCNRERPVRNGNGKMLSRNDVGVVLDMIEAANGRLTCILTDAGRCGWVLSGEVKLAS